MGFEDIDIVAAVTAAPVAALTAAMIAKVDFDIFAGVSGAPEFIKRSR